MKLRPRCHPLAEQPASRWSHPQPRTPDLSPFFRKYTIKSKYKKICIRLKTSEKQSITIIISKKLALTLFVLQPPRLLPSVIPIHKSVCNPGIEPTPSIETPPPACPVLTFALPSSPPFPTSVSACATEPCCTAFSKKKKIRCEACWTNPYFSPLATRVTERCPSSDVIWVVRTLRL